jgi:hypothetical protein
MRRVVITGFAIWLLASVALRLCGQYIFRPDSAVSVALLLGCSAPLMLWLPRRILQSTRPGARALAAIALVAPGMLLDTFSTIWFPRVFPNIPAEAAPLFGGWLLLCNVLVLVSAALFDARATGGEARPGN